MTNMYGGIKTWNPFKGCEFNCTYCEWSFKAQAKRLKHLCNECYTYAPHCHEERLDELPPSEKIFACGNGDVSFCPPDFMRRIIAVIAEHPAKTFYLQSKDPKCFGQYLPLPANVVLITTLETNRNKGYDKVSNAPKPSRRKLDFQKLDHPRKVVTIEPMMDFDCSTFLRWIIELQPEHVWIGFDTKPHLKYWEPGFCKISKLIHGLRDADIPVRGKDLRGLRSLID